MTIRKKKEYGHHNKYISNLDTTISYESYGQTQQGKNTFE